MVTKQEARKTKSAERPYTRGGVSPKPGAPAIHGAEAVRKPSGTAPTAGAFPGFNYQGGPVVACPWVYTSFWGPLWLQDPAHLMSAGQFNQYHADLLQSGFMNVLSQYGVGWGAGSGAFIQASFVSNIPNTLTDSGIQAIIQSCIAAGALPEPSNPSNTTLIIYLDETIGIEDPGNGLVLCEQSNDTAFGYHNFFITAAGNPFYYAIIPALSDACLTESCPGDDAGCSLHLYEQQQQRQTQVASHEFAEMTTDPQLNAWLDPINGENGDICNGESDTITVGANTWTVQPIYSKYDDINSGGAIYCLSQAPNPKPRLSPGPSAVARAIQMEPYTRLLPLPSVQFDAKTNVVSVDNQKMHDYVKKVFYPLRPEHIMSDFPGFLRNVADAMTKR